VLITAIPARIMATLFTPKKARALHQTMSITATMQTKTTLTYLVVANTKLGDVTLFADMQYRRIYYSFLGFDRNLNNVQQSATLNFFNPKVGITYELNERNNIYASFAVGNHEPNRDDYTNSTPQSRPKPENLKDFEAGYRTSGDVFKGGINGFYMLYKNQLILTGALNDVGAATRVNVDNSYRAGIEFDGVLKYPNS
jgi:iron complex outermembrane receptor protein